MSEAKWLNIREAGDHELGDLPPGCSDFRLTTADAALTRHLHIAHFHECELNLTTAIRGSDRVLEGQGHGLNLSVEDVEALYHWLGEWLDQKAPQLEANPEREALRKALEPYVDDYGAHTGQVSYPPNQLLTHQDEWPELYGPTFEDSLAYAAARLLGVPTYGEPEAEES